VGTLPYLEVIVEIKAQG